MQRSQDGPSEAVFVWSSGGIRRRAAGRRAPRIEPLPVETSGEERDPRRFPRLDKDVPVLYRVVGRGPERIPTSVRPFLLAQSRDLSPLGLCLSLEEDLPPGTVMSLAVHLVEARERFEALARVVWCGADGGSDQRLVGLEFVVVEGRRVRPDLHARLQDFLHQLNPAA